MNKDKGQERSAERDYSPERIIKLAKPYNGVLTTILLDKRMDQAQRELVLRTLQRDIEILLQINERHPELGGSENE